MLLCFRRLTCAMAALLLLAGCSRRSTVRLASEPSDWKVQLEALSEPAEVMMQAQRGGIPNVRPKEPDRGQKWVAVRLTIVAPEGPTLGEFHAPPARVLEEIRLSSGSASFPAIAVGTSGSWEDSSGKTMPAFVEPRDNSYTFSDPQGHTRIIVDDQVIKFPEREPVTIELLFSVPARSGELILRF